MTHKKSYINMKGTVIIPAYNEVKSIGKCLQAIHDIESLEVLVICNGCTDSTFSYVKNNFKNIRVFELEEGSKSKAINFGLNNTVYFPVLVLDADITITKPDMEKIFNTDYDGYLCAAPKAKYDLSTSSYLVRKYYQYFTSKANFKKGFVATGAYLITISGYAQLQEIPDVISDDGYVKAKLQSRFLNLEDSFSLVTPPRNISNLTKIKTRSELGNIQLKTKFNLDPSWGIKDKLFSSNFVGLTMFLLIKIFTKVDAKRIYKNKFSSYVWSRDESSRSLDD